MWRRPNVACARAVLFVLLTSLAPGILAASGRNATPQRDVTRVPSYVAVWEASKDAVDVEWVRARVAEAAKSGEDRDRALSAVEEKLGLTCEDLAQWEPAELRRFRQWDDWGTAAHAGLRVYLEVVQRAINIEVPRVLEERSPSDHPDMCREAIRAIAARGKSRFCGFWN